MLCHSLNGRELEEKGYMYMHGWVGLLSTWNYHNFVNWLYFNRKIENRKTKGFWYNYCPISWVINWTFLLLYHYLKGLILLFLLNCDSLQIFSIIIDWMTNKKINKETHYSKWHETHKDKYNTFEIRVFMQSWPHFFFQQKTPLKMTFIR